MVRIFERKSTDGYHSVTGSNCGIFSSLNTANSWFLQQHYYSRFMCSKRISKYRANGFNFQEQGAASEKCIEHIKSVDCSVSFL